MAGKKASCLIDGISPEAPWQAINGNSVEDELRFDAFSRGRPMRIRPLQFGSASVGDGDRPIVRWLGEDFPKTLNLRQCLAAASEVVPFLPDSPAVGVLEAYWSSWPQHALVVAPNNRLLAGAPVAVSREPAFMRVICRPSAEQLLILHAGFRQRLLAELHCQNIAASCVLEGREGDLGAPGLYLRCGDTARGIWVGASQLEAHGVTQLVVARLADTLK
ncbi:MAG: hypothetical protein ACJ8F7_17480 [Gemmataceae bacterium]